MTEAWPDLTLASVLMFVAGLLIGLVVWRWLGRMRK